MGLQWTHKLKNTTTAEELKMNREQDTKALLNANHGDIVYVDFSSTGYGLVHKIHDVLVLFEADPYSTPIYVETYSLNEIDKLLTNVYNWE